MDRTDRLRQGTHTDVSLLFLAAEGFMTVDSVCLNSPLLMKSCYWFNQSKLTLVLLSANRTDESDESLKRQQIRTVQSLNKSKM